MAPNPSSRPPIGLLRTKRQSLRLSAFEGKKKKKRKKRKRKREREREREKKRKKYIYIKFLITMKSPQSEELSRKLLKGTSDKKKREEPELVRIL